MTDAPLEALPSHLSFLTFFFSVVSVCFVVLAHVSFFFFFACTEEAPMLNEVYAPKTAADLAWSRQKCVALSSFIRGVRTAAAPGTPAAQTPRILLLYGPPGCGKLESLKVLLQEDVKTSSPLPVSTSKAPAAAASASATTAVTHTPTSLHVFHTCEATTHAYAQFLQHVMSLCSGQLVGGTLALTSSASSAENGGGDCSGQSVASSTAVSPVDHAHIIKFYGEPVQHPLHRCTLLFLRQYEELRTQALLEAQQQLKHGAFNRANTLLDHLRHNLIFFIHTTHDSHNDKLDLGASFPSAVLQSSAVELFHCTPVTEINLKKRLKQILECEASRRALLHRAQTTSATPAVVGVNPLFCSTAEATPSAPSSKGRRSLRGVGGKARREKQKVEAIPPSEAAPSSNGVLDHTTVDAIVAGSQGDIRQALLQIQWVALVPLASAAAEEVASTPATAPAGVAACELAAIWTRLQKRRALARTVSGAVDDRKNESSHKERQTGITASGDAAEVDHDAVLILSSSSSSEVDSVPPPSASRPKLQDAASGDRNAGDSTLASRKRSRSPPPATALSSSSASSTPHMTDMLSLLDSQMSRVTPSAQPGKKASIPTSKKGTKAQNGARSSANPGRPEHRSVLPTTRDEYLGLSHATGRLLTQKYSIDEVLDILNVPPRKLLDYLTNNQVRYFSGHQLPQCAACAAAASEVDALRTFDVSGVSAAALRERRQLADRTTAGESVGNTARLLDVIALQIHHLTYLARQTEVHAPPGFSAQEPPPFLRSAYPRVRDAVSVAAAAAAATAPSSGSGGCSTSLTSSNATTVPVLFNGFSEQEWTRRFLMRLDSASAAGVVAAGAATTPSPRMQIDEVDILREGLPDLLYRCGSTESAVVDYYALAPYAVLHLNLPPVRYTDGPTATVKRQKDETACLFAKQEPLQPFLSPTVKADSTASPAGPRRTVFKFAAASSVSSALSPPPPPLPRKDRRALCTWLQLKIMQRGRDSAVATLREDRFALVAAENIATEGAMGEDGDVEERPWIPEGEDIEDD